MVLSGMQDANKTSRLLLPNDRDTLHENTDSFEQPRKRDRSSEKSSDPLKSQGKKPKVLKVKGHDSDIKFVCPFYKRNPVEYSQCSGYTGTIDTMVRVGPHSWLLYRPE